MLVLCAVPALAQTTPPLPPSQLHTTGGQSSGNRTITLGWAGNGDTPASAYPFQYNIYRGTTPGGEGATPIATLSSAYTYYSDAGLSNGTTYYYRVTAANTQGESAPTDEASATAQSEAVIAQGAPSFVMMGAGNYSAAMDITDTGDLPAQSVTVSALVLVYSTNTGTVYQASQTPAYPLSLGDLAPGASFHLTGLYSNVPTTTIRAVLVQGSYTSNGQTVSFSFKPAPSSPTAPTDLAAYATGSGKITLYWSGVPNATGYNVYRNTESGGDYGQPINGATPVASFETGRGVSNLFQFSDTGLTDGQEYFYTVEAVSGSAQSGPSNKDSNTPTADAIPWDGSPSAILSKVHQTESNQPGLAYPISYALLRVMRPDGVIYQDGVNTPLPPDGSLSLSDGTMTLGGDTYTTGPFLSEATAPFPASAMASAGQNQVAPQSVVQPGQTLGGMRRVVSVAGLNGTPFTGSAGTYYLPSTMDTSYQYISGAGGIIEGPNAYLGLTAAGVEIDAGVLFAKPNNKSNLPNRWEAFVRINDGTKRPDGGYIPQGNNFRVMGTTAVTATSTPTQNSATMRL